jgi:phosphoglucomutase
MNKDIIQEARAKAETWLQEGYDKKSQEEVKDLLSSEDTTDLVESFYKNLEFGTGGLRGIMGVGSNRMNIYTVGAATQGLANYINKCYPNEENKSVCIGHDCRNKSRMFAETVADIFSANGIKAYLFEDLRPTPEMSYCIRELKCKSGVIITASHNPKEYNGYKAYWADGGQLVPPHDKNVIDEVNKVEVKDIKFEANKDLIEILPLEIDKQYLDAIKTISLSPESVKKHHDLKIVFTPIHGTTYKLVPESLKNWGFTDIYNVPEQDVVDGNFPTVESANPEEPAALSMALEKAKQVDAEIVMACDPDGDRLGIATKNDKSEWVLINGNQTAILFTLRTI